MKDLGFLGLCEYFIDNCGMVYSDKHKERKTISQEIDRNGYHSVKLYNRNGKRNKYLVHRLVLLSFVGPPSENQECRHLDGDKSNNNINNLCWGTRHENQQDRKRHGTYPYGEKNSYAKLMNKDIPEIFQLRQKGLTHKKIAQMKNVHRSTISLILKRKTWSKF